MPMRPIEKMESASAIAAWRIYMVVISALVSALLALLLSANYQAANAAEKANVLAAQTHEYNLKQDARIDMNTAQEASMMKAQQSILISVSELTLQVAKLSDHIDAIDARSNRK